MFAILILMNLKYLQSPAPFLSMMSGIMECIKLYHDDLSKIKVAKPEEQLLKRNRDYDFEFQFRPN